MKNGITKHILRIFRRLIFRRPYFALLSPREVQRIRQLEAELSTQWQEISLVACLIIREDSREAGIGWGDG